MTAVLFVHADGTREWREAELDRRVWLVPKREPRTWRLLDTPRPPSGTILTFRREVRGYGPDWSGPLESWWRWEEFIEYDRRLPGAASLALTKRMKLLPTIGMQSRPVKRLGRVEIRFVEETP